MTDAPAVPEREGVWARLRRRKVVQWGLAGIDKLTASDDRKLFTILTPQPLRSNF